MGKMAYILFCILTFLLFGAVVLFFITSLIQFLKEWRRKKKGDAGFDERAYRWKKTMLVIASILLSVLVAAFIALCVLLYLAIAYM